MKLKHGVSIAGCNKEILVAKDIADKLWLQHGRELVITAGTETPKVHMENSRHAYGDALDMRIKYFDVEVRTMIAETLQATLFTISDRYYVKLHKGSHIHVQWK